MIPLVLTAGLSAVLLVAVPDKVPQLDVSDSLEAVFSPEKGSEIDVPDGVLSEPEFLEFDGKQFNQLFLGADLPNLASIDGTSPPVITGNSRTDARIREIATRRGYARRPEVLDRRKLVRVESKSHWLQPLAAEAYLDLKAAAAAEGHHIHVTSAFRSYDTQRRIFLLYSAPPYTNKAVNQLLKLRSIPGYSKHHTGYAIDIGEGPLEYGDFGSSERLLEILFLVEW